jgi:hypothetical protein
MAKNEAHDRIIEALTSSSPLLSEVAGLLAQTSLPVVGLPTTDAAGDKPTATALRSEGVTLADLVTRNATVVSLAAPDLALAAPNFVLAATA